MDNVRIGLIGVGSMGSAHAMYLHQGEIKGAELRAVLDVNEAQRKWARQYLIGVEVFADEDAFFSNDDIDAILIATPHYDHPRLANKAFKHDKHVLCEKPAGVYTKQVREMNELSQSKGLVFSMMYNQRTNPLYMKVRDMVQSGELGEIKRMNWIITNWYRSQSYYDSSSWRATWKGEGGGVLINQCPHQLDLWQWMTDLVPTRIRAFCQFGKHRAIEVEDEVTAYIEHENGATGVFVTTTGEAPGTNRLEVAGDRGKIVVEESRLLFWRLRIAESEFNQQYKGGFGSPECWECTVPVEGVELGHKGITQNFVDAIVTGENLIAPGVEGIKGLTISNAMQLSTWIDDWVTLPLDEEHYYQHLQDRIKQSTAEKKETMNVLDVKGSH
ncbi:Gfo/Idh/MocA family protein [Halalkalibacter sp. APA_J-10(15)]|uniref:Gfo/Idh/MocA family protein n=1 Tax=Halalkalibacter sp. APA_J-10(15) TaxID=2933805 RepID=UPI001FF47644|nr:Gfo/Idh/MocA family oxidoreductase [Halalkalibacter sp. APA_J-10(15)]MCK0473409.1 Gfo/Idh/MocA family oxidoreductase [Halalkalibacter sp. APA_J-10(15)]